MVDKVTIGDLPEATSVDGAAWIEIEQNGEGRKVRFSGFAGSVLPGGLPDTTALSAQIDKAIVDINELIQTYGTTVAAAEYADAAEAARLASVNARGLADQAASYAEAASDDASASRDLATGAVSSANAAAADAQAKATLAAGSALQAAGSATTATSKADAATGSASASQASAVVASSKATDASNAATAAATSASTASTKATEAGSSATAANTSKLAAETAKTAAQGSSTAAQTSANAAGVSATNAGTSATSASTAANTATSKAADALSSANAASTSASGASTSATNAGNSATAAQSAKVAAETAGTNAANSASAAATSNTNATASKNAAATSASAAATSATNAATSASNASTSATQASTSKTDAAGSAASAGTSATNAATSAGNSFNSATASSGSASTASTKANDASTSATAAAASALSASTKAGNAATSATNANNSAVSASASAAAAQSSATLAATYGAAVGFTVGARGFTVSAPSSFKDGFRRTDGSYIAGFSSMWTVMYSSNGIDWASAGTFNTLNGVAVANQMANALNTVPNGFFVVVFSFDEPATNHQAPALVAAMLRCGASRAIYDKPWGFRSAYILVGQAGIGEGRAARELYRGTGDNDPQAYIETSFSFIGGVLAADGAKAAISEEASARASAVGAVAQSVTDLSTTVGAHTASIATQQISINGVAAQAALTINVGGFISGWSVYSNGYTSDFTIDATRFRVGSQGASVGYPFEIVAGITYIKSAYIRQLSADVLIARSIQADKITIGGVTTTELALGAVSKLNSISRTDLRPISEAYYGTNAFIGAQLSIAAPTGAPVRVDFKTNGYGQVSSGGFGGAVFMGVSVYRIQNGARTLVTTGGLSIFNPTGFAIDTPAAGATATYQLEYVFPSNGQGSTGSVQYETLILTEFKR